MEKTICFTGKRPRDLYGYDFNDSYMKLAQKLYSWMMDVCTKENVQTSITGGAQGFDQIAFWVCTAANIGAILKRRKIYVPFKGQEKGWVKTGLFGQGDYESILYLADEIILCSDIDPSTASKKEIAAAYLKRNRDMVDASDICFGLFDTNIDFHTDRSGTAATLRYAESKNKEIWIMDLNTLEVKKVR